jgi:hypothetical protein
MTSVFIVCAAVGGTILVCQFVLMLIGLGGHAFMDVDMPADVGHAFGGDFHGAGDFHGGGDGLHGDAGLHADHAGGESGEGDQAAQHGATWLFGVLSFRTITAALTFFGLAGWTAHSAEMSPPTALLVAVAAGVAAMYAVYWMMQCLYGMQSEGNVRIQRSLGQHGNVYLRIPANRSGSGKIQFNLQNRTMEYLAVTAGPELPTGAKVVIVGIVNPTTLEVQAE